MQLDVSCLSRLSKDTEGAAQDSREYKYTDIVAAGTFLYLVHNTINTTNNTTNTSLNVQRPQTSRRPG